MLVGVRVISAVIWVFVVVLVETFALPGHENSDILFDDPDCAFDGRTGPDCDSSGEYRRSPDYSDAIAFPDEYDEPVRPPPRPPPPATQSMPFRSAVEPVCPNESATYCEHVPNYPAEYIESQISADPLKFEELFGADEVAVENRFGEAGNERPLCQSRETIIFPKSGLTQDNTWMYIVNFKNYVQGIRVEICIHTDQCLWPGQFPFGYEPICKQKYIYRQLLAIDSFGRTVKNSFQVPCCCECVMTSRY